MAEILKGQDLENELKGREPLTGSIKLRERESEAQDVLDDFEIEGVLHAGGSCICYKAVRSFENSDMSEAGILKEFYPVDSEHDSSLSYNLKRYDIDAGNMAKQLFSEESTLNNFINAKNDFYSCYKKISDVKKTNDNNINFFAPIRIYRGIANKTQNDNYTIYIWSPGDNILKSFDDHLNEMQKRIKAEIDSPQEDLNLSLAYELHTVLQSIQALAMAIENLHFENLLHLDIKPSNFGIKNLGKNTGDNISVSLFDVNTIYSRSNSLARTGGTPGFRAPEMTGDVFNNYNHIPVGCMSDIYSLGATLYNSIIVGSDSRGIYELSKFSEIDTELSHSLLFEYSEYNAKSDLFDCLVNILKRSLARTASDYYKHGIKNYISVGEFINDIAEADKKIKLEIDTAVEAGKNNKATLQLVDKEDYYDSKIDGGAVSSMQCLLYDHPLYDYVDSDGTLNVLVLGSGVFGQKFIDIAFELSQIKNCYLNVTVVSKDKENDQARYLNSRPELKNFFAVNGEKPKYDSYGTNGSGGYGSIDFIDVDSRFGDSFSAKSKHNVEILKNTLKDDSRKFGYVFISLTDELLNKKLASDLAKSDSILSDKAIINFVSYKDLTSEETKKKELQEKGEVYRLFDAAFDEEAQAALLKNIELNPVFVKNTLVNHADYKFLSRMAFNCHLLWGDGLNVDINKSYRKFRALYNYTGSFANALSIKYKLHSIKKDENELELKDVTAERDVKARTEKARLLSLQFRNKIGSGLSEEEKTKEQKDTLNELTMFEHRRWVVNMICSSSYSLIPEKEYKDLATSNKDTRNRRHTCIVPSKGNWALNEPAWQNLSKWDKAEIEKNSEFKSLDPLDKMSVLLHRHFFGLAKKFNRETVENDATVIRRYLYDSPEALAAFNMYMISLRTMTSIIDSATKGENIKRSATDIQQETITRNLNNFKKYLTENFPNVKDINKRLDSIVSTFEPVRIACSFTDYKSKDQRLVYNIPFILNYSTSERLCIPFVKTQDNNGWFDNVASSIVINPSMVTYLIDIEDSQKILSTVKDTLANITKVMDGHSLQTKIALILYVKVTQGIIEAGKKDEVEKVLKDISPRIYSIDIVEIKNQKNLASRIKNTLETNQKSASRFSAIEINNGFISGIIYSLADLSIPTYEFNSMKKSFCTEDNDDAYIWYKDIPFDVHLNVEDMFFSQGKLSVYQEPELHRDYEKIWKHCYFDEKSQLRSSKTQAWKALCAAIRKKSEKENLLAEIVIKENNSNKTAVTAMFMPSFCRTSIEKLFDFLSSSRIQLIDNASIREHNSSMLAISFKSTEEVKKAFLKLFSNPYALIDDSKLKLISTGRFFRIVFDSLVVNNFSWNMVRAELKNNGKSYEDELKDSEDFENAQKAFNYLVQKGYVIKFDNHTEDSPDEGDSISFCFASSQIKKLLSNEGQLLELYTYYQTIENGYFDEVKTGLEVQYKKDNNEYASSQEFDLVAVKGFRSQIVEIKARKNIQQEFYQKLKSNGDKFGINKELLLVSDFGRNFVFPEDEEFINRGKEDYNVDTVTDIENIGEKLTDKMKKGDR